MAYPDPKIVTVATPTNVVNTTRGPHTRSAHSTARTHPYVVVLNGGQHTGSSENWRFATNLGVVGRSSGDTPG